MAISPDIRNNDTIHTGKNTFTGMTKFPDATVTDAMIASAADIASSKVVHRFSVSRELFAPTTTVVALTELAHIARKGGVVAGIEGLVITPATGADRTITVDLQKSTGGAAYASILTTTVDFDDTSVARTAVAGVVAAGGAFIDGDSFQLVVTVAGAAGAQAAGLLVTIDIDQNPNT